MASSFLVVAVVIHRVAMNSLEDVFENVFWYFHRMGLSGVAE